MRLWRIVFILLCVVLLFSEPAAAAGPFILFPQAEQILSPNGLYAVRNVEPVTSSEFVGTFHALWLFESTTGRSRKLCDYFGVSAVAWAGNDFLLVTQYLGKKTSRAFIFPVDPSKDAFMIDVPTLIRMLPIEQRPTLRLNDHVFVEASQFDGNAFRLRVWGYGPHDTKGFHWNCTYAVREGSVSCAEPPTQ